MKVLKTIGLILLIPIYFIFIGIITGYVFTKDVIDDKMKRIWNK